MTLQPFAGRLALLRAELVRLGIDGLYLQRTDPHGSEYLPASEQRVAWLTGFTGSAGIVTVTADKAAVFSDGRYTVQLDAEVDGEGRAPLVASRRQDSELGGVPTRLHTGQGGDRYTMYGTYFDDAVRTDDGWKLVVVRLRLLREEGNRALMREAVRRGKRLISDGDGA